MHMSMALTSSAGVVSLLKEPEDLIKIFALNRLNELVDDFWAEISEAVSLIEELSEREDFSERDLASLVASKVYYHLGSFQDALSFALGAGDKFDVNGTSEYIETILSVCIDQYTELRVKKFEGVLDEGKGIDGRLEAIVMRMFERCLADKRYKQAIGIAFETRRIDVLRRALLESVNIADTLTYCLKITLHFVTSPKFRREVLELLVATYKKLEVPDYISVCQCLIFLDDPLGTADILETLTKGSKDDRLIAYQIAFDLYESATQRFLKKVQEAIRGSLPAPPTDTPTATTSPGVSQEVDDTKVGSPVQETGEGSSELVESSLGPEERASIMEAAADGADGGMDDMDVEPPDEKVVIEKKKAPPKEEEPVWVRHLRSMDLILGGEKTIQLHQEFLIRNNNSDLQVLKNTKEAGRNSIIHNATVLCNGLMHFGTTSDVFLRENLDWLKRASNWAKFTATASLGLIHFGHEKEALNLMSSYLPKDSSGTYAEGGGLFAIGLIHANHGVKVIDYLSKELRSNTSEIVRHGGCLGLGLAAMGTENEYVYELLKENLMTRDDAVIGEAAGLAMGLVMIGTASPVAIDDMINYARDTQHEKIQRGLALGIALLMYGQLEEADTLIEDLIRDKDPLLRRSGMFTIAMAYCGSSDNKAIRKLLHVAVSDVDDDVRRAAVTSLGFILFRTPDQCPHVVSLLSESFNPHVRCGSAMALGIACAGSGNKEALAIIEPMITDSVPFVQQAALVASAMILIQHSEAMSSKVNFYRQHYAKIISDKHEHNITKLGGILAQGIIDAGGRNVTISLQSRTGHMSMRTAVGLLVFSQFWFWYPLVPFLSLSFTPTALIGLNMDLKMPKMEFRSNAKPSLYAYPQHLKKEKETLKEKVATAVLSITAKSKTKEKKKDPDSEEAMEGVESSGKSTKKEAPVAMDTDSVTPSSPSKEGKAPKLTSKEEKMETGDTPATTQPEATTAAKKEVEANFQLLSNPARVLPQQLKVLVMEDSSRYQPFKPISVGGIIMLRDTLKDGEPEDLIEPLNVVIPGQEVDGEEPDPPEPFEWTDE